MVISFDSRKKSYPAYILPLGYAILSLLFPDRWNYCWSLLLVLILFLGCYGLGKRLSFLVFKTADQTMYFPFGLGIVLAATYAAAQFTTSPYLFYLLWGAVALFSVFETPVLGYRMSRSYFWAAPFVLMGFWSALTPTIHPEALSSHLGLAHQYLLMEKMKVIPHQLYSALPPFGQTFDLLFASMKSDSGIRAFSIVIYFQIISILASLLRWLITEPVISGGNGKDREYQVDLLYTVRMEMMVVPVLLMPGAWLLVHYSTPDLMASLFFTAGITVVLKEFDYLSSRKIFNSALFFSFALWAKYSVLLYVILLFVLWLALSRWRLSREYWKLLGALVGISFALWLPFLVRNLLELGDPFYPALSGILSDRYWSPEQSVALERDLMGKSGGLWEVFTVPLLLVFQPDRYGPAAEVGIVWLLSLAIYPLVSKLRTVNQILVYIFFCYLAWIYTFRQFTHFLPAFLLLNLICYFSFRHLHIRSPKYMYGAWGACALVSFLFLVPVYFGSLPLIRPSQTQSSYLRERLDYFVLAEEVNQYGREGKIWMVGDGRLAYFRKPLIASSRYDQNPLWNDLRRAGDSEALMGILRNKGIRYILFNETEFFQTSFKPSESHLRLIIQTLAQTKLLKKSGPITLYEIP